MGTATVARFDGWRRWIGLLYAAWTLGRAIISKPTNGWVIFKAAVGVGLSFL